jgi:hypothetical protein
VPGSDSPNRQVEVTIQPSLRSRKAEEHGAGSTSDLVRLTGLRFSCAATMAGASSAHKCNPRQLLALVRPPGYSPTKVPSAARTKSSDRGTKARQPPSSTEPMTRTSPCGLLSQRNWTSR